MFCGLYSGYMGTDSVLFWCPLFVCFGMLKRRKLRFQESAALGKCLFREREKEKKAMRRNVHGYENYDWLTAPIYVTLSRLGSPQAVFTPEVQWGWRGYWPPSGSSGARRTLPQSTPGERGPSHTSTCLSHRIRKYVLYLLIYIYKMMISILLCVCNVSWLMVKMYS